MIGGAGENTEGRAAGLEQFKIGSMRDIHPENEVPRWCSITAAWFAYHVKFLGDETFADEEERKIWVLWLRFQVVSKTWRNSVCRLRSGGG